MLLLSRKTVVMGALCLLLFPQARGDERAAAQLYEKLRRGPQLEAFLRAFPKGGDLHTHLGGAVAPEKLLAIAARQGFCLDSNALLLIQNLSGACPAGQTPADNIPPGSDVYQRLVNAMSMRGNRGGPENGHAHFFQAFRFRVPWPGPVWSHLLEDVVVRAAGQNIAYLEPMIFPFNIRETDQVVALLRPEGSLAEWWETLEKSQVFARFVAEGVHTVARGERELMERNPAAAAAVERRYLVNLGRTREPANVFAQLAATAALTRQEPRVVGVNLAAPEDYPVARRDFRLHMRMLDFLVSRNPQLRVSLHAGELTPRLLAAAPPGAANAGARPDRAARPRSAANGRQPAPEDLTFHIGESVWQGRAERIGHGSSLLYERDRENLLRAMRERGILVELCLTSEAVILGLTGNEHPFRTYRTQGVPVSLNTDDEGILDTDLTHEFLRAVRDYRLRYFEVKELARNSMEYSFLPGRSLFRTRDYRAWVPACANSSPAMAEEIPWMKFRERLPAPCREYLDNNPKAEAQLRLEHQLAQFEAVGSLARFQKQSSSRRR